jgi:hypothetical protein
VIITAELPTADQLTTTIVEYGTDLYVDFIHVARVETKIGFQNKFNKM